MNKKRVYLALSALVLLTLFAAAVQAALLDPILQPFQQLDLIGTYARFGFVIDAILYFVILVGAAQVGLGDRFSNNKSIAVAVGIALGLGAAIGEYVTGFRLGQLWPLALLMAILSIAFAAYNYFKQLSGTENKSFAMLGFAFLFFYFTAAVPGLADVFRKSTNPYMQLIWAALHLAAIICLIWGLISLVTGLTGWGSGGGGGGGSGGGGSGGGGSGGPGLWSRFWDWRDKRNKEKGEQHPPLDYKNPCTVKVKVVDLHDNPINGAKVTITGVKDWSFRDQEITDVDGNIKRAFSNIPSGHFHIEARHPNYKFWSLQLGTEKNKRHREIVVSGGETADVLIRMDRVEELGVVKGRIIDEDKAKAETRVNRKSKGSTLNDKVYEIGNKDLKQVVALERVERGTGVEYVDMGVNAVTTDADGYFEMQKLPLGKNFVIGTPIDIPGHRNCYVTHLGWVIDNILYRGTKYGRGGQGGSNDPPPKDIYLGKKGGDWNVPHEKGFSKLKYAWTVPRGAVSKISKWTKYYGNEDNVVISFTKKVSVIGTVRGKVVNGSYVIKHMLSRPPKYANAADIINDTKRWPRGPGLPNSKVRATYYFEDRTNPRQATPWVPAGLDGMYTLFVPVTAIDVVVEVRLEPHGGGSVKVGVHVGWPLGQCPAGTPNAPFDLTPGATDRNDVLLPIWGVSLPDVKVI